MDIQVLLPVSERDLTSKASRTPAGFFLDLYLKCIVCIEEIQYKRSIRFIPCVMHGNLLKAYALCWSVMFRSQKK